jgi:mRNA-degrading endonuclease RelE of RelBE toxin-antitoxin system
MTLTVSVTPQFKKMFSKLERDIQEESLDKIELFKDTEQHVALKVHGTFKQSYRFSVNYKIRIVFEYLSATEATLTAIGDDSLYK